MEGKTIAFVLLAIVVLGAFGWFFYYVFGTEVRFSPDEEVFGTLAGGSIIAFGILAVTVVVFIFLYSFRKKES
jgi:hypothetical protein